MAVRKTRGPRPANDSNNNNRSHPSDYYESDNNNNNNNNVSAAGVEAQQNAPPAPLRTNEELNISVLRRHNPSITTVLSLAPYTVVYVFSATTPQWEKSGIEGTMFVCQLSEGPLGEERYGVYVLNRRGLNNFELLLTDGDNVEVTDDYVILKADSGNAKGNGEKRSHTNNSGIDDDVRFYGLWIYSEPPPNSTAKTRALNAQMIKECAVHAGQSRMFAEERQEAVHKRSMYAAAAAPNDQPVGGGRRISLQELFGQQRAVDDGWSIDTHPYPSGNPTIHTPPQEARPYQLPSEPSPPQDVLGDLFRRAGLAYK